MGVQFRKGLKAISTKLMLFAAVRLHRMNGMTNGIFRCDIPDTMGNVRSLHIGIYNIGAGKHTLRIHCCIVVLVKLFEIRRGFNCAK